MSETATKTEKTFTENKHYKVDVRRIRPLVRAGGNIRKDYGDILELAKSIAINGVVVPFRGFKIKEENYEWESIDGHRRTAACHLLIEKGVEIDGKLYKPETVYVPIITVDSRVYTDEQMIVDMVTTNSGKQLNCVELSNAVNRLKEFGMDPKEIGARLTMSTHAVRNLLLLGSAPKRVRDLITENKLSYTVALDFLKTSVDFNEAVEKIENALSKVAPAKSKSVAPSKNDIEDDSVEVSDETFGKITRRHLDETNNKVDSVFELKKVFKKLIDQPKTAVNQELFSFAKRIVENKLTASDIEKLLF